MVNTIVDKSKNTSCFLYDLMIVFILMLKNKENRNDHPTLP